MNSRRSSADVTQPAPLARGRLTPSTFSSVARYNLSGADPPGRPPCSCS